MNWTGGRLSRHSAASKSANAKQKQHFARIQQNLRNNHIGNSPAKWSVFSNVIEEGTGLHWRKSTGPPSKDQHLEYNQMNCHATETVERRPASGNVSNDSSHLRRSGRRTSEQEGTLQAVTGDVKNPLHEEAMSRKRKRTLGEEKTIKMEDSTDVGLAKARRKNLLQQGSWIQAKELSLPQASFLPNINDEDIGKRRRIHRSHLAKIHAPQEQITSPFAERMDRRRTHRFGSPLQYHQPPLDLKIRIGSQAEPISVTPSIAQRRFSDSVDYLASSNIRSRTSSVMLLDSQQTPNRHDCPPREDIYKYSSKQTLISKEVKKLPRRTSTERPKRSRHIESCASSRSSLQMRAQKQKSSHSYGLRDLTDGAVDHITRSGTTHDLPFADSSSTAELQHPQPKGFRKFTYQRSNSANSNYSIMAQVGENVPLVPPEQILDEAIWRTWLDATEDVKSRNVEMEPSRFESERSINISPGVSVLRPMFGVSHAKSSTESWKLISVPTSSNRPKDSQATPAWSSGSVDSTVQVSTNTRGVTNLRKQTLEIHADRFYNGTTDRSIVVSQQPSQPKKLQNVMRKVPKKDDSEMWKKFVNGCDGSDDDFIVDYSNKLILGIDAGKQSELCSSINDRNGLKRRLSTPYPQQALKSSDLTSVTSARATITSSRFMESLETASASGSSTLYRTVVASPSMDYMSLKVHTGTGPYSETD